MIGCSGPAGTEGPAGQQGPAGPVGPAGEDGSMMYASAGPPSADVGVNGDYYLNTITGEMYGPKDDSGWDNPIIVLMGEDGQDGSQIYSGTGVPESTLGVVDDYYLDKSNYELYGPKTSNGWGTPLNLKGADGNANVTRYLFPQHDFSAASDLELSIPDIQNREEMLQSSWQVYLETGRQLITHIPGIIYQTGSEFAVQQNYMTADGMLIWIDLLAGPGEVVTKIIVVRIESSSTMDLTKANISYLPNGLNLDDYFAVADYYGF